MIGMAGGGVVNVQISLVYWYDLFPVVTASSSVTDNRDR